MAVDPSWQNEAPPPKKGLSVFGKVLIGCGAAFLCFVIAVGAMAYVVVSKATSAMDRGWAQMRAEVHSLRTEEGARELYRKNPGLAQNYPTEEDFVKASAEWRSKLEDLPASRPTLKEMMRGGRHGAITIQTRASDGAKVTTIRMRMASGSILVVEMDNDKLTDIRMD